MGFASGENNYMNVDSEKLLEKLKRVAANRNAEVFLFAGDKLGKPSRNEAWASQDWPMLELSNFVQAYRHIDKSKAIDIVLCGNDLDLGSVTQIGRILMQHSGKVTVVVPGPETGETALLALAADEVVMAHDAWLCFGNSDVESWTKAARLKRRKNLEDWSLVQLHRMAQTRLEMAGAACEFLHAGRHRGRCRAAQYISSGKCNHNNPARPALLASWGMNVTCAEFFDEIELQREPGFGVLMFDAGSEVPKSVVQVLPTCLEACPVGDARRAIISMEQKRGTKVIAMVHASGTSSDEVDRVTAAEALKAIKRTQSDKGIDLILHTPGGIGIYGEQIARALKAHPGAKSVFVPYLAYSAGTIIALAADEIHLSSVAALGPIDAQMPVGGKLYAPAAALASILREKNAEDVSDLVLARAVAAKATIKDGRSRAIELMKGRYSWWTARKIARYLNDGYLTHEYPIMYDQARRLGLRVTCGVPEEVHTIVDEFTSTVGGFCSVIHCSSAEPKPAQVG